MDYWEHSGGSESIGDGNLDLLHLALDLLGINSVGEVARRALAVADASAPDAGWAILHRFQGNRYDTFVNGPVGHDDLRRLAHEACREEPWLVLHDDVPPHRLQGDAIFRALGESETGNPDLVLACWCGLSQETPIDGTRLATVTRMVHAAIESAHVIECLIEQSSRDPLTGLLNRRGILESLGSRLALSRRRADPVAVLYIDVDHFKSINDTHGHGAGDEVLIAIASRLDRLVRASDAVGRMGGDEFLVVLDDTDLATARRVGRRLARSISAEPVHTPAGSLSIRLAYGAASLDEGLDQTLLLEQADRRMLSQKKRRRGSAAAAAARPAQLVGERS